MNQQKIIQTIKMVLAVAVLTIGTTYVLAADWTAPPVQPPGCPGTTPGCNVPINTSVMNQVKLGGLGIGGFFSTAGKAVVGSAAPTIVDTLKFKVDGKMGAEAYCDRDGNNCSVPPFGGTGGGSFWRQIPSTQTIENTNTGKTKINGKIIITGGNPAENKVLVAQDSTGLARWRNISELIGNTSFVASCANGEAIQSIDESGNPKCVNIENRTTTTGTGFIFAILTNAVVNNITGTNDPDGGGGCDNVSYPGTVQCQGNGGRLTCIDTGPNPQSSRPGSVTCLRGLCCR